jgi:phosphomannomutase
MRENVSCPTVTKASAMAKLKDRLPAQFHEELKVSLLDGIKIATEDWWLLLRSSGTEPTIRVTAEAKDEKKAKDLLKLGVAEVSKTIKEESG